MNKKYAVLGILAVLVIGVFISSKVISPSVDTSKQGAVVVDSQVSGALKGGSDIDTGDVSTLPATSIPTEPINGQLYKQCSIKSLTAAPASVIKGATTTISWTTQGCKTATLDGVSVSVLSGSKVTSALTATKTFTLVATGSGSAINTQTKLVTVVVKIPSLTITTPNGNENYTEGQVLPMTWTSANIPAGATINASLQVYNANNVFLSSVSSTPQTTIAAGQGTLILPTLAQLKALPNLSSVVAGKHFKYYIVAQVQGVALPIAWDYSDDFFSINAVPAPVPAFTIMSPNGNEVLTGGQQAVVTWTSANIPASAKVGLSLRVFNTAGVAIGSIGISTPAGSNIAPIAGGQATVVIPTINNLRSYGGNYANLTAGKYFKIQGVAYSGSTTYADDMSDGLFTIH